MRRSAQTNPVTDRLVALSEPLRQRVLSVLERHELSVGEIAQVVQLPQSTVSRHLKLLLDGGWLIRRSVGTATYYRMVLDELDPTCRALWLTVREQLDLGSESVYDVRRVEAVLAARSQDSRSFFGRLAGQWDEIRGELFGSTFTAQALLALLPRDWTVADLGCGTGNVAEMLAPWVRQVIAVDQSEPMLEAARKRLREHANLEFVQGEMEALPLPDASVDAAVMALVLHHLPEPAAALRESVRVLRAPCEQPGGVFLLIDMVRHDRAEYRRDMGHQHLGFGEDELADLFEQAGLSRPEVRHLRSDPDAKGPGLQIAAGRRTSE